MAISINELRQVPDEMIKTMNEQSSEAVFRAYINRTYYCIYHQAKCSIEQGDFGNFDLSDKGTFKTGTHNRIYEVFLECGKTNTKAKILAFKFRDFLNKRHKADYQLTDKITWYDVLECKKYFETIPTLLKEIT
ncbi:hypothetical protein CPI31_01490 [Moraxella catarrhalis]|uniref:hypothetical protein n=1 Tax=Moraxella catarrhalis TaxID=480 RepID=UPI00128D3223|nr:hypothetical protein [Moraxella catarrhalis]MPX18294.1 hypothetical protein [Moraxella catarrhalis]